MKTTMLVTLGIAIAVIGLIALALKPNEALAPLQDKPATLYKSMTCGCCGVYGDYAQGNGLNVQVINSDDPQAVEDQYKIPAALRSCHTTIVDGYFVEGHIPLEAVAKLTTEKPDIAGIAMAGMPQGSPGMPGAKTGPFIIYAVNKDGSYNEYMRI